MTSQDIIQPALAAHGAARLPAADVECYNVELKDDEGFVGDRASKGAFREFIEAWRKPLRDLGEDPFGDEPSSDINRKRLDALLGEGDSEAAGIVHSAIESFAQELAGVTQHFLKLKGWKGVERLVIGGGMAGSRVGELAVGRASVILKAERVKLDIVTIRNDPDHAGLLGGAHLAPAWIFKVAPRAFAASETSDMTCDIGTRPRWTLPAGAPKRRSPRPGSIRRVRPGQSTVCDASRSALDFE